MYRDSSLNNNENIQQTSQGTFQDYISVCYLHFFSLYVSEPSAMLSKYQITVIMEIASVKVLLIITQTFYNDKFELLRLIGYQISFKINTHTPVFIKKI